MPNHRCGECAAEDARQYVAAVYLGSMPFTQVPA